MAIRVTGNKSNIPILFQCYSTPITTEKKAQNTSRKLSGSRFDRARC